MITPQRKPVTPAPATHPVSARFNISTGIGRTGFKLGIYGPEGIGKSSLAASCPGVTTFADIEGSMADLDCSKIDELNANHKNFCGNWDLLLEWVRSLSGDVTAGIDSITRAEDWAAAKVIKDKLANDNTRAIDSLEDFKYKAGLTFVGDKMRQLFSDIDASRRRGVSWIMVAHQRVIKFTNPDGDNFFRYEPRLINDEKQSVMLQWVQFLDHLAYIGLDLDVKKGGKATGKGSRAIYLDTTPSRVCKARGIDNDQIVYPPGDLTLWGRLGFKI
jgi:hypothetical protein